ncbi:MAG: WD40 repeat domain-containing protein [Planctomycetota bacterium]|nr:WD40 repeat domain-containing protein [Planctomycetota bacterium]
MAVLSEGDYRRSRLWLIEPGALRPVPMEDYLSGNDDRILAISPTFNEAIVEAGDGIFRLWRPFLGPNRRSSKLNWDKRDARFLFSPDGTKVLAVFREEVGTLGHIRIGAALLDTGDASSNRFLDISERWDQIYGWQFSSDGEYVAILGDEWGEHGTCRVFSTRSGEFLFETTPVKGELPSMRFCPDGKAIVMLECDRTARLYEVPSGKCVLVLPHPLDGPWSADFSPDGRWLLVVGHGGLVLWERATGKCLNSMYIFGSVFDEASFFPDNRRIAVSSYEGVWILEAPSLKLLAEIKTDSYLPYHALSPDGERMVISESRERSTILVRRRPEWWWGIFYLPFFWLTVVFSLALAWSLRRDWLIFRQMKDRRAGLPGAAVQTKFAASSAATSGAASDAGPPPSQAPAPPAGTYPPPDMPASSSPEQPPLPPPPRPSTTDSAPAS